LNNCYASVCGFVGLWPVAFLNVSVWAEVCCMVVGHHLQQTIVMANCHATNFCPNRNIQESHRPQTNKTAKAIVQRHPNKTAG
jgi:hypothetical protein